MYWRSVLEWLIYNLPLDYAQLLLDGDLEKYVLGKLEHLLMD